MSQSRSTLDFQLTDWDADDLLDFATLDVFDFCRSNLHGRWRATIRNASGRSAGMDLVGEHGRKAIVELELDVPTDARKLIEQFPNRFVGG